MDRSRNFVVVVLATALFLSTAAPGFAATASHSDPIGDASRATDDIVDLSLTLDRDAVSIRVRMAAILPAFTDPSWSHDAGGGRVVGIELVRNNEVGPDVPFVYVDGTSAWTIIGEQECAAEAHVHNDELTVEVESECLGFPGSVQTAALTGEVVDGRFEVIDVAADDGNDQIVPVSATEPGGYWILGGDGGVFSFGTAQFHGSTGDLTLNQPVVGMSALPSGNGYRFVAGDGGVFNYGAAQHFGSMGGSPLNRPIVGMAGTPSGNGYWLVASDGGIFAFGDAQFHGSMGGTRLNQPIVGMTPTSSGNGYWLVASDGGIFAFGDAQFHGSTGGIRINRPIVGMAASSDGYYLVGSDGSVFAFGEAHFYGSLGGVEGAPVVGMAVEQNGYRLVRGDGTVTRFGYTYDYGDLPRLAVSPNQPVVSIATLPQQ